MTTPAAVVMMAPLSQVCSSRCGKCHTSGHDSSTRKITTSHSRHSRPAAGVQQQVACPTRSHTQQSPLRTGTLASSSASSQGAIGDHEHDHADPSVGSLARSIDGFFPDEAPKSLTIWQQLRWCGTWRQVQTLYSDEVISSNNKSSSSTDPAHLQPLSSAPSQPSLTTESSVSHSNPAGSSATATLSASPPLAVRDASAAGVQAAAPVRMNGLSHHDVFAFLIQLQDFFHEDVPLEDLPKVEVSLPPCKQGVTNTGGWVYWVGRILQQYVVSHDEGCGGSDSTSTKL